MFALAPQVNLSELSQWLEMHYDCGPVSLEPRPSERDWVGLVISSGRPKWVLKIANPDERPERLAAQNRMMDETAAGLNRGITVLRSRTGADVMEWTDTLGRTCWARVLSYLPGTMIADLPYRSPELLQDIGAYLGGMDRLLDSADATVFQRPFVWNLCDSRAAIESWVPQIQKHSTRSDVQRALARFDRHAAPFLSALPKSLIHNDANEHNLIVTLGTEPTLDRLGGVIDFGDAVYSWTVAELAVALAYLALDADDVWEVARPLIRGYDRQRPLSDAEFEALFGLVLLRLCTSIVVATEGEQRDPDNVYLQVSQAPIERTLPILLDIPYRVATATFRESCGRSPYPPADEFRQWLKREDRRTACPLQLPERPRACPIDLSPDSPLLAKLPWPVSEPVLSAAIETFIREQESDVGIGDYLEPRCVYQSAQFGIGGSPESRRTIHLGLDYFAPAGTAVCAAADGIVEAVGEIDLPLDYGTVVVLRHEWEPGRSYWSLYGHLERFTDADPADVTSSAKERRMPRPIPGTKLRCGQVFARLGEPNENGGWPPHLHWQLLLDDLEQPLSAPGVARWSQARVWQDLAPDPRQFGAPPMVWVDDVRSTEFPEDLAVAPLLERRHSLLGGNLRCSYREPLHLVLGRGTWLYDAAGRGYLDAYNNVPHLGHAHPEVVAAAHAQMQRLNTNTRYVHRTILDFAERLTQTMPPGLEVCYFVNSGSEANELALRLAWNAADVNRSLVNGSLVEEANGGQDSYPANFMNAGRLGVVRDTLVMEHAYHGHTSGMIDCSPYKHAGPGGCGAAPWVHVVPLPDTYRGPYRDHRTAGEYYAADVEQQVAALVAEGRPPAAWLAETCPSVAGQWWLPAGYLARVYEAVRRSGGVCIADEVQTGYGRTGVGFYAFEAHGVVPDIVVLGKPIGNGYPLAAVVTSRSIAEKFDNGMEFFSTFGGSTVSCAVGDCVLRITQRDQLTRRAAQIGEQLGRGFRQLQARFAWLGDVRGAGLFWGLDLVHDPVTRQPDPLAANFIKQRLRDRGILIGTDGVADQVLKIRPPMVFNASDAERLLGVLNDVMHEWNTRKLAAGTGVKG